MLGPPSPSETLGGRGTCPGPPRKMSEHPLTRPLGLELGTQIELACSCTLLQTCPLGENARFAKEVEGLLMEGPGMCLAFSTI